MTWLATFASSMAALVAVIVAYIGWQQHKLAKDKFKLDLFEKRFAIYKGAQVLLTKILCKATSDTEMLFEYRAATQDAIFLFDDRVSEYLNKIDGKAVQLLTNHESLEGTPIGDERNELCENNSQLLKELLDELSNLKTIFLPYLKFDGWR